MDIARPSKRKRWLRRIALSAAILAGVVLLACILVQWRRDAAFAAQPAPGSFVTVDGHRLHYRLLGQGDVTFVLECGLGDYSENWRGLETSLAQLGRVFVYDRAGTGWSEAGPSPRSPERIADELHAALLAAKVPGPYILVGHSWGGYTQMLLAERHPADIAGLFLIDPSHPQQMSRMSTRPPRWLDVTMMQFPRLARLGLPQLLYPSPEPIKMTSRYLDAAGAEFRAALAMGDASPPPPRVGNIPLCVLSSGIAMAPPGEAPEISEARHKTWLALHEELMTTSTSPIRRHLVVVRAGHYIHHSRPNFVASAARDFLEEIRRPNPPNLPRAEGDKVAEHKI